MANVLTELTPFRVFVDQVITVDYVSLKLMNVIPIHAKMELSALIDWMDLHVIVLKAGKENFATSVSTIVLQIRV